MSKISFANQVDSVDFSNSHIVVGLSSLEGNFWDGGIQLFSYVSGELEQSIKCDSGVTTVRFIGEDKSIFVSAKDDGSISLHKAGDISDQHVITNAHDDCVSTICPDAFAPGLFLTGSWDGSIKMWDVYSNDLLKPVLALDGAHQKQINDLTVCRAGAASNSLFASVGQDGFLRLWDNRMGLKNGCAQIHNVMQAVSCVEWDNVNGDLLYVGTDAGQIGCYDIRHAGQAWTALQKVHTGRVRRIRSARSADGVIFSASDDCTIAVSDTSSMLFGTNNSMSPKSGFQDAGITSFARLNVHRDYVADLALIETPPLFTQSPSGDSSSCELSDPAVASFGDCSVLSASSDKTIRLTPFSFIDMEFA